MKVEASKIFHYRVGYDMFIDRPFGAEDRRVTTTKSLLS